MKVNYQLGTGITWICIGWIFYFNQEFDGDYYYLRQFISLGFVALGYLILPNFKRDNSEVEK